MIDYSHLPMPSAEDPLPREVTHVVDPDGWTPVYRSGVKVPETQYPLLRAIEDMATGIGSPVVEVHGVIPGGQTAQFGGGDAGIKRYRCDWGQKPMWFEIRGTPGAVIPGFYLHNRIGSEPSGGVSRCFVRDVDIVPAAENTRCIGTPKGHDQLFGTTWGLLKLRNVRLMPQPQSSVFNGFGLKWGIRAQGRIAYDLRGVTIPGAQEHGIYIDSPQPGEWGGSVFHDIRLDRSQRTCIQVVNRSIDNPGPSGSGHLLISDVTASNVSGEGGAVVTVAGHLGPITIHGLRALRGTHAAIAVWRDTNPLHGVYEDASGYTNGPTIIDRTFVDYPAADRDACQVNSAASCTVGDFIVRTARTAWDFDRNGSVRFDLLADRPSQYKGWLGRRKVTMNVGTIPNKVLTDEEIDALGGKP